MTPRDNNGQEPTSDLNSLRVNLLVLYSPRLEECESFYSHLGLRFATEQHGQGPRHYAATLANGTVFEIYPARSGHETGALRLGLTVVGIAATR